MKKEINYKIVGRLEYLQGELSLGDFAKKVGVIKPTLRNYMLGRHMPDDAVILICKGCMVSPDWLLMGKNDSNIVDVAELLDQTVSKISEIIDDVKKRDLKNAT